jgi:hypothetical protein
VEVKGVSSRNTDQTLRPSIASRPVTATRYLTPLREGGSLPGLMEADDLGTYVVKFHGAGQGPKALVAEIVSGELARALGLPVPELVTVELDPALAAGEGDPEIQELLRASGGTNLGMDFLPGALDFDPAAFTVDGDLAGRVLWFDALVGNVDRSWRNPNMLYWHGEPYLIDHGSTLTFHHRWSGAATAATRPYDATDHVLIGFSPNVEAADAELAESINDDLLRHVVAQVPEQWLDEEPGLSTDVRSAYVAQLTARLHARSDWLPGLVAAATRGHGPRDPDVRGRNRPDWLGGEGANP